MPISRDDVVNAYRLILGREPENEDAIRQHVKTHQSVAALRDVFLGSGEFARQLGPKLQKAFTAFLPPAPTARLVGDRLEAVVGQTGRYWEAIGRTAPHWSVLTEETFRPTRIDETAAQFYASGAGDRDFINALLARIHRSASEFDRCVEFGCGVGRLTIHLSASFSEVVAIDISQPHLDIAEEQVAATGATNVKFLQATGRDPMPARDYDLWFSRLVLQHNPPPIVLAILDQAFAELLPGGVAIVHVPTYIEGYEFDVDRYLSGRLGSEMEMHATPQKDILEIAAGHGCRVREVHEEPGHISEIANIFVFTKD